MDTRRAGRSWSCGSLTDDGEGGTFLFTCPFRPVSDEVVLSYDPDPSVSVSLFASWRLCEVMVFGRNFTSGEWIFSLCLFVSVSQPVSVGKGRLGRGLRAASLFPFPFSSLVLLPSPLALSIRSCFNYRHIFVIFLSPEMFLIFFVKSYAFLLLLSS